MLLRLKVKPNSDKVRIKLFGSGKDKYLKIWLKSPPKKGKANKELDKILRKKFGEYKFVSGATSRDKFIKIREVDLSEIIKS